MSTNLKAALVLTLNDQLTAGLNKIKGLFGELGSLGKKLGLGKLETGAGALERTSSAAQGLTGHLRGVAGAADRAYASLKRMGSASANWGKRTFGPMSRTEAFTGAAEGFSVIEPIRAYANFENTLRHIAITKGLSGAAADTEIQRLNKLVSAEALTGGQSSTSVAAAYYGLQTGGAGTASQVEEALGAHTRAATAYNIDPEAFTPVTLALMKNFKIFGDDLGRTLAAVGRAAKQGQMKVTDFAEVLPQVAGQMNTHGMTGRENANFALAALQTIRTDVGQAGQAGTDFNYMLDSMYTKPGMLGFALHGKNNFAEERAQALMKKATGYKGIDVSALIDDGAKRGLNPVDAVLTKLMQIKSKLTSHEFSDLLGGIFTNEEARKGWQALINHFEELKRLRGDLNKTDASQVGQDFETAFRSPKVQLDIMVERLEQLNRTLGQAFVPIMIAVNYGLSEFMGLLDALDNALPGAKNGVLLAVGSFLTLSAGVAALRVAMPVLSGAFSILGGVLRLALAPVGLLWRGLTFIVGAIEGIVPAIAAVAGVSAGVVAGILVAVAALVAAAYDIYAGWATFKGFFEDLWQGVVDVFEGATLFIIGVFLGRMDLASAGLRMIWHGIEEFFGALWDIVRQLFVDFGTWVDGWTGGAMTKAVDAIKSAWGELKQWFADLWADIRKPFDDFVNAIVNSPVGHLMGLSASPQLQPPGSGAGDGKAGTGAGMDPTGGSYLMPSLTGQITVGVDPNNGKINIQRAETSSPGFSILNMPVDPGLALGVP